MTTLRNRHLAGIFLISATTLSLEISLTRYFSISQHYHFAFLVVSIAFLGFGASGSFLSLFKGILRKNPETVLSTSSFLFSVSIILSFTFSNALSFDFITLSWDKSQVVYIFLYYILMSLPFFFAGLTLAFMVSWASRSINRVYFSDLLGAGTGTLLALIVFLPKGDKGVILILSSLALMASFLFGTRRSKHFKFLLFLSMTAEICLFIFAPSFLSFRISPFKALPVALHYPNAKHLFTKWNPISRIDAFQSPAIRFAPGLSLLYQKALPPQLGLSVDGEEPVAITHFNSPSDKELAFLSFLPSSFAFSLIQQPKVLIIEPRGGLDVIQALHHNAPYIKIVESNPLFVKILQSELAEFSSNLYLKKNVHVAEAHIRTALKKEKRSFDLIVFSLTDVFGAAGTGLHGFGENYLYTGESIHQALNRLSPDGIITMSFYLLPPPRSELRALATLCEVLEKEGKDPRFHLFATRSWGTISCFIKNSPFSELEIQKLKSHAARCLFDLVYYPGIDSKEANIHNVFDEPFYYNFTLKLLSPSQRSRFYQDYLFQIKPVSDNRPFFYNFVKIRRLKDTFAAFGQKWLPFLSGELLVFILLLQSGVIAFVFILFPLLFRPNTTQCMRTGFVKIFFYFSLIGSAFMFVEITLIQKFILFLGHPLYSASFILFSLLFSSAVGSLSSKKILGKNITEKLRKLIILLSLGILSVILLMPLYFQTAIGLATVPKIFLSFVLIFPLGFLMGFPFPTGIRLLESQRRDLIPWAWAVNAFFSVISSSAALLIAFWGGYNLVFLLGALSYSLTLPFLHFARHGHKPDA